MAALLFETHDRAAAHQWLDRYLAKKPKSKAECREDVNADKPFQVWDGPESWKQTPLSEQEKQLIARHRGEAPEAPTVIHFTDAELEKIGAAMGRGRAAAKKRKR